MRLFVALDIDDRIRQRLARYIDGLRGFASEVRWMNPDALHVTLKFIGEQPDPLVGQLKQVLGTVAAESVQINFRGYGFFPAARAARVFWVGIEAGPNLASLAATVDDRTATLGIPTEARVFSPHLTLARGRGASGSPGRNQGEGPSRSFERLQEQLVALPAPEFGTMTAREFFLYQSQLSPKGSTYAKLAGFALT